MDAQTLEHLLIGIAAILGAILTAFVGMWKWDVHRAEVRAAGEVRAAAERAKEREHELQLAGLKTVREAEEKERALQTRLRQQDELIISIQQTIEERLFKALDDARTAKRDVTDALAEHTKAVQIANQAQLAAIQALSGDVANLRTTLQGQLSGEYRAILERIGGVLDQSTTLSRAVGDLVAQVAEHHTSVMQALEMVTAPLPIETRGGPSSDVTCMEVQAT
jgi:hypothetical protein